MTPQPFAGSDNVYEGYECLIDRTNTWLIDQADVSVVNLQSILVQKDHTHARTLVSSL